MACQGAEEGGLTDALMTMEVRARGKEKREGGDLKKYGLKRRGKPKDKGVCDLHLPASTTDGNRVYCTEF